MKPIFNNIKEPKKLWIADKPPRLGGIPVKKSIKAVEKQFNIKFTENIFVPNEWEHRNLRDEIQHEINNHMSQFLYNPMHDQMVICKINEEVGYGVFARKYIADGTFLCAYAGEYANEPLSNYGLGTSHLPYGIDAEKRGGIGRFFQHLPTSFDAIKDTLQMRATSVASYERLKAEEKAHEWEIKKFPSLKDKHVMKANLKVFKLNVKSKSIFVLMTTRSIVKGDQLGFDYGEDYWEKKRVRPKQFDPLGNSMTFPLLEIIAKYRKNRKEKPDIDLILRRAATVRGSEEDIKELLRNGAKINSIGGKTKRTAMHWAAIAKNDSVVTLLMMQGADIDIEDIEGKKPMDYSVMKQS